MSNRTVAISGTVFWLALAAHFLGLISWTIFGLIALPVIVAMALAIRLFESQPHPELVHRRRQNLCLNLMVDLERLKPLLVSAKAYRAQCEQLALTPGLTADVANEIANMLSAARADVSRLEGRITQTEEDLIVARRSYGESNAEMVRVYIRREDYRYACRHMAVMMA